MAGEGGYRKSSYDIERFGATVNVDLEGVWPALREAVVGVIEEELTRAENKARQLAPVGDEERGPSGTGIVRGRGRAQYAGGGEDWTSRTPGTLRDSILSRVVVVDDGYTVLGYLKAGAEGSEGKAFYARFVELGTKKMAARPFLRPAAEEIDTGRILAALEGLDV